MATDIAFALGVLALVGGRLPVALKSFLLAVAIVDDIGAILVIAILDSGSIQILVVLAAVGLLAVILVVQQLHERGWAYFLGIPCDTLWAP